MPVATKPTLKLGDEGIHVNDLQSMLWMLDYLEREYITSIFDFRTEHAVKTFQSNYNLRIDGIVGPETWAALEAVSQGWYYPKPWWQEFFFWVRAHKALSCLIAGSIGLGIYLAVKK